jgi:hypothetical protein
LRPITNRGLNQAESFEHIDSVPLVPKSPFLNPERKCFELQGEDPQTRPAMLKLMKLRFELLEGPLRMQKVL